MIDKYLSFRVRILTRPLEKWKDRRRHVRPDFDWNRQPVGGLGYR
jgi:hypothetical protein